MNHTPLPSFRNPPVVEVVLGAQFEPIRGLGVPQIGMLWREYRDRMRITSEHAPLEPVIERFGMARQTSGAVSFQMLDAPPVPRCWFQNDDATELIQVQPDRFIRNWRKTGDNKDYPRYTNLREAYSADLGRFFDFLNRENLGPPAPNQCEVTYVNHILSESIRLGHGEVDKVLGLINWQYSDNFLKEPEEARLALKYVIPDSKNEPIGRLHLSVDPVYRVVDDAPMFRVTLTARGRPQGEGMDGIMGFLDIGRSWVVRAFASITTSEMHRQWSRENGG